MTGWRAEDIEWLEAQYFPWSSPFLTATFSRWSQKSEAYRARATIARNVQFGERNDEVLDLLRPQRNNAPILIFIHGGYWQALDKDHYTFALEPLVNAGALVATVNYTLCPQINLSAQINQIRAACAWLWRHAHEYGGNAEQLHIAGHSAGGHLAAMLVTTEWPKFAADLPCDLIKSATMVSGLFDLDPLRFVSVNEALQLTIANVKDYSPQFLWPVTNLPICVMAGAGETQEFRRQSQALVQQWRERIDRCEYIEVPGEDHFTVIEQMPIPSNAVTTTLLRHLGLPD